MKWYLLLFPLLIVACQNQTSVPERKPRKFDRDGLEKGVKAGKYLYDAVKYENGKTQLEKYYLGDTARYELFYTDKGTLYSVYKSDEHGQRIWQENYYDDGTCKARLSMKTLENGAPQSVYHGPYEEYYENGKLKESGEYAKGNKIWTVPVSMNGKAGDTTRYEYK